MLNVGTPGRITRRTQEEENPIRGSALGPEWKTGSQVESKTGKSPDQSQNPIGGETQTGLVPEVWKGGKKGVGWYLMSWMEESLEQRSAIIQNGQKPTADVSHEPEQRKIQITLHLE